MTKEETALIRFVSYLIFITNVAGIFTNIFIFKIGGLQSTIWFNLISLIMIPFWFVVSGYLLKNLNTRLLLKIAVSCYFLLYLLLFFLQQQSIHVLTFLGILSGTAGGLLWSNYNLIQYIHTHESTRHLYIGQQNFWINMAFAFGPVLGGSIIYLGYIFGGAAALGYLLLFFCVSILILTLYVDVNRLPQYTNINFSISHIIFHRRASGWIRMLIQQFLTGISDVSFSVLSGILIFIIIQHELELGILRSASSIISAVISVFAAKVLRRNKNYLLVGALIPPIAVIIFAFNQNWLGILSIVFLYNLLSFLSTETSKTIFDEIDKNSLPWEKKYHLVIERDLALGLGRILSG